MNTSSKNTSHVSRRSFLSSTGAGVVGVALAASSARAMLPKGKPKGAHKPTDWLPDSTSPDALRALASAAVDAARDAGASFADIRIGEKRRFGLSFGISPWLEFHVGYGVRVLVNGSWGFVHGQILTADAVTGVARQAVNVAKGYAGMNASLGVAPATIATVPVVKGEWANPVQIDPFSVSIDDHIRWKRALSHATDAVFRMDSGFGATWEELTRVYASTDGSLITQRITRGDIGMGVSTYVPRDAAPSLSAGMSVPSFESSLGGFELVLVPDLVDRAVGVVREVIRRSEIPRRSFDDVGRFPVVCDGESMAQMAGQTVSSLLDADRASGEEADASGTTYLVPPAAVRALTDPPFSPLLTVTGDRAMPNSNAVKWDDEGVATGTITLVKDGHVENYLATRSTTSLNEGAPLVGCVTADSPDQMPFVGGMRIVVAPSKTTSTLDDMLKGMTHGFLVRGGGLGLEPGLTSGTFSGDIYEIRNGKEVARINNLEMPIRTRHLWKEQLHALGDASTIGTANFGSSKGMPWQGTSNKGCAPAAMFTDVDVTRTDFKLN